MQKNKQNSLDVFSAWEKYTGNNDNAVDSCAMRLLAFTPFETPDLRLAQALLQQNCATVVDIGRNCEGYSSLIAKLERFSPFSVAIRVPDNQSVSVDLLKHLPLAFAVLTVDQDITQWAKHFPIVAQVHSVHEAEQAIAQGAVGLIAKGRESGGLIGDESSYILLQRLAPLAKDQGLPLWSQGGIGFHTAAAAIAGGAYGVVLDSQLSLLPECSLNSEIKAAITKMDGSETACIDGYRVYSRPGLPVQKYQDKTAAQLRELMGCESLQSVIPVGQDACLAVDLMQECSGLDSLFYRLRAAISGHVEQAQALSSLSENSPLAQAHQTRYPVVQGPMTRVSDTAGFAVSVAENGALPFLALSLMNAEQSEKLLVETVESIGEASWGVGILGFADAEILNPQIELIKKYRPSAVLLAGGRPSQAHQFEELGIITYLHVPAPGLLDLFLKDGARHFIFEGQECGGHVGPRLSFVLWEQQINRLLQSDQVEDFHILFAGGIHDARSAAMIAVLAAPLVARGAKVGVLMGSAYIATQEAVEQGAVLQGFQEQVIAGEETALLETAPGHATRCLKTNIVDEFNKEKDRLTECKVPAKDIWQNLEQFNVGRLRIASKGLERKGNKLQSVSEKAQKEEGLYMIGQVAAMRNRVVTMSELHESVSTQAMSLLAQVDVPAMPAPTYQDGAVAIVGMDCIYAGSPDLESFWENILAGRDLVTEVSDERWNKDLYYSETFGEKGKTPSKWGGFIDDFPFDPLMYGIPPQSLAAIEPVQLLSLEVARRAMLDAGYDALSNDDNSAYFNREKASVIFGAESGMDLANNYAFRNGYQQLLGEMPAELDDILPELTEDSFPGVLVNVIAGRVANRLNLCGVNYTVDSACASSLTAVELAVKELRNGSSDMVLAGGADFHNSINDYLMFASVKALSASGRCRSFDGKADGIALGEGVAVVVLKRLEDAERDGDKIYAVIDGVAGSSDGKSLGLTAPRKAGQKKALERAYNQAGITASSIGLVEAHGTGTVVGDRTEMTALTEVFNAGGALSQGAALGSVKSQIGHTKCAAGVAGLIKLSKALYHRVLPPTCNIEQPNAYYNEKTSPFVLGASAKPWLDEQPRAALSAFGFGGTNFHAVLSAYQNKSAAHKGMESVKSYKKWPVELFLFRGDTPAAAESTLKTLINFLQQSTNPIALHELSYVVDQSHHQAPIQISFVARDVDELSEKLSVALSGSESHGVSYRHSDSNAKVAFLFPGQGSQTPGMLQDLFVAFPQLQPLLQEGRKWKDTLYPPTAYNKNLKKQQLAAITDTRVAQPTLGIVDYAMSTLLETFGVKADMLAGHSYGELVALCVSGCLSFKDLLPLSEYRGQAILQAAGDDAGTMAAVSGSSEQLKDVLKGHPDVVLANQNSPSQTVISGATKAIEAALKTLKDASIPARAINVACAFHSPVVAKAEPLLAEYLEKIAVNPPSTAVYSNTTTERYPDSIGEIKETLARHVAEPVRFVDQIKAMYKDGARHFVEVGPSNVLSGLTHKILEAEEHSIISTDKKGRHGLSSFLEALAKLSVIGDGIDSRALFMNRDVGPGIDIDLTKPQTLSATTWWINGQRCAPMQGALPKHAGKIITEPLQLSGMQSVAAPAPALNGTEEHAVLSYLQNVRDIVHTQRDVMVTMLGGRSESEPLSSLSTRVDVQTVSSQAALVEPVQQAASTAKPVDREAALLNLVSDRTGYPLEMLELDLDLEADLSIDSIKRIEIIGELAKTTGLAVSLGSNADTLLEDLATQKTLREMIGWLSEHAPVQAVSAMPTSTENAEPAINFHDSLLSLVSDRTGYPIDMLELDLDLEADLSIDSIKRIEIIGELAKSTGLAVSLGSNADTLLEDLATQKTLREMIGWLSEHAPVQAVSAMPTSTENAEPAINFHDSLLSLVSDRTGYPIDMLELDLDLEADLSIDSIKRIEIIGELAKSTGLAASLGADADTLLEDLATQKTLRTMIDWLQERVSVEPAPSAETTTGSVESNSVDFESLLLSLVSDRTGYPTEMLELDLDLEADLSIDSIKRIEIIGELAKSTGLATSLGGDADTLLEELASQKNLRDMIDWLLAHQPQAKQLAEAISAQENTSDTSGNDVIPLSRYILKERVISEATPGDNEFSGKQFLITDDGLGIAQKLASRLESHGANVRIIDFDESDAYPGDLEKVDGLLHLWGVNPKARVRDVKRFYRLLRESLLHKTAYLLVAAGLGGGFGAYRERDSLVPEGFGQGAGFAGMLKSVAKEWPEVRTHWIDLNIQEPADELAAYLELELLAENPLTEVGYRDGERYSLDVVETNLPLDGEINNLDLTAESVVLLTGGARGITAKLAITLAARYGCHLELLGRSAQPPEKEDSKTAVHKDLMSLRKYFVQQKLNLKPAEIEKRCSKILAEREIRETFKQIETVGATVNYTAVDVRDIDAFSDKIEKVYVDYGRIDGVIHGAGVIEDKLLRHKTEESFERVFDTKVRGALILSKLLRDDVTFVVFFSSVSGAFGNKGQVDYASANDALDKIAHSLQARIKGRVLSVNWGPWADQGMVSAELEREYASQGVGLINPEEGVAALLDELQHGERENTQVVLMCATPESMGMAY